MTQENIKLKDCYETSDLALATAISLWYPIEALDHTKPRKTKFIFIRKNGLDKIVETFWKRQLKIDALSYFNQLKMVKSRLYEARK